MVLLKFSPACTTEISSWASTFHYGSIKIFGIPRGADGVSGSTFHYGSIKMIDLIRLINTNYNLHSTMVLLKLKPFQYDITIKESTFHYGSIKIIFLLLWATILPWSTFHYGSIKMLAYTNMLPSHSSSTFHYGSIKIHDFINK